MTDSVVDVENARPANPGKAAEQSLWKFLKPMGPQTEAGKTGFGAIKKEQLAEHHFTPLSKQQQNNIRNNR